MHCCSAVLLPAAEKKSNLFVEHAVAVPGAVPLPSARLLLLHLELTARAALLELAALLEPGGSVRGERANLSRLVLGCIEAKFCK